MNKETFEALKVVVALAYESNPHEPPKEIEMVEKWIEEKHDIDCWDCKNGKHLSGKCQVHNDN